MELTQIVQFPDSNAHERLHEIRFNPVPHFLLNPIHQKFEGSCVKNHPPMDSSKTVAMLNVAIEKINLLIHHRTLYTNVRKV